jgi:hypothetical protein
VLAGCRQGSETMASRPCHGRRRRALPEICQKRCLTLPDTAPCRLRPPQPLSCDVVVQRGVLHRHVRCPLSLHTAEVTGSIPVTPTSHHRRSYRLSSRLIAAGRSVAAQRGRAGAAAPSAAGRSPRLPQPCVQGEEDLQRIAQSREYNADLIVIETNALPTPHDRG